MHNSTNVPSVEQKSCSFVKFAFLNKDMSFYEKKLQLYKTISFTTKLKILDFFQKKVVIVS